MTSDSDRAEREEKEAHQEEQHAWVVVSSVVGWGQFAVVVGLQTGSVSHDMGNVVLLLDPVEEV